MLKRNLHKALALLASVVILCSILPISALFSAGADVEGNIVVNGDFENGKDGWAFNSGTAEIVADANGGSNALQLTNPGAWGEAATQYVSVSADTDYKITWYSKRVSGTGPFNLMPMNPSDWSNLKVISGQNWMNETSGNWVKNELVVNTGSATQVFLKVTTEAGNPGSIIIDDVVMTKVGGGSDLPVEEVEVVNGDFETGDSTGWTVYQGTAAKAEAAHDGSYGLHLTGDGGWGGMAFQNISVNSGTEYTVKMWLKAVSNGVNIQIKDGSESGALLEGKWFNTTDWILVEFKVTPTTSTICINICGSGNGTAESVYLDDVTITGPGKPEDVVIDVVNGDFETGDNSGWTVYQGTAAKAEAAHDGSYGLHLTGNGGWGGMAFQNIPVESGKEYTIKMWMKTVANGANIQIKDGSESGAQLDGKWFNTTDWTLVEFKVTPTSSILCINICGAGNGIAESVYLDDVTVTAPGGNPSSEDVAIQNGDFETGDTSGWTVYQGTAAKAEAAHSGNYGLHLIGDGGWGGMAFQEIPVEAGKEYTVTMWAMAIAQGVNIQVKDGGTSGANLANQWFNSTSWSPVSLTVVPTTEVLCINICGGGTGSAESVYLDDVTVTVKLPVEPTDELLVNGDFETGDITGWENLWDKNEVSFIEGRESSHAMSVISGQWTHVRQKVTVEANTDYTITGWYKDVNKMCLVVKDGADSKDMFNVSFTDGTAEWTQFSLSFNSGTETSLIITLMGNDNGAKGIFDDLSMVKGIGEPITPPEPEFPPIEENQLKNGGFEEGAVGWNWTDPSKLDDSTAFNGNASAYLDNPKQYGEALTQQVALRPDTDYVIIFYTKRDSGSKPWSLFLMDASTINSGSPENIKFKKSKSTNWFQQPASDGWVKTELEFNSGSVASAMFKFGPNEDEAGTFWLDNVGLYVKGYEPKDEPEPEGKSSMILSSYGVLNNRPITADKNMLINGNFESTGGQWDVDTFHTEYVSVVDDSTTLCGNKSLFFNTSALENKDDFVQPTFWLELEPNTEYVFSAWLKGAKLSEDNAGRATIGIVDVNGKFLANREIKFLDGSRQLVPTAWDDEWHLRSVQFNTGVDPESDKIKVGIALSGWGSQMWIDDMALFLVGDGIKYMSENMAGGVKLSYDIDHIACADKDSLIPDPNMKKYDESKFWSSSYGWRNGFISFQDNEYEYGTSMKYTSTDDAAATYIIKWVDVEPHTQYTFAVDLKIIEDGFGRLGLLDNKKRDKVEFFTVSFDSYDYDDYENTGWRTVVTSFNTDVYDKIGIAFVDDGGEALLDNMRLFKNTDGKNVVDTYIDPPVEEDPGYDAPIEEEEPVEEEEPQQEETVKKKKYKKKVTPAPAFDPMVWVWVGAGSAVALAGAAVTIILLVNKRKKAAAAAAAGAAAEADATPEVPEAPAE